jgi:phosphomannomutase
MELDSIFKAYDVRGLYPSQINEAVARAVGYAFARFAGVDRVAVGRDCRISSPSIAGALMDGITAAGVDVADLGEITTDALYYVSGSMEIPGVIVTASHNPPEYNGLKFCLAGAAPVGEETGLRDVKALAAASQPAAASPGSIEEVGILRGYVDHLFTVIDVDSFAALRVAADGGNGMAGIALPSVFDRLPASLIGLYLEPDGTFPNHPADPLRPENLADLLSLMDIEHPDFGVAFDGDADRAFFIDVLKGGSRACRGSRRNPRANQGRPLLYQTGDEGDGGSFRRRTLRPLLLPGQLPSRLGHSCSARPHASHLRGWEAPVGAAGRLRAICGKW